MHFILKLQKSLYPAFNAKLSNNRMNFTQGCRADVTGRLLDATCYNAVIVTENHLRALD